MRALCWTGVDETAVETVEDLIAKGAVRDGHPVKVLGTGEIGVKVSVTSSMISSLPSPAKVRRPSQISCARTAEEFALASIV